jgi:hypothetical protein
LADRADVNDPNRGGARDLDFNKEKGELIEDGINRGEKLKNICTKKTQKQNMYVCML